MRHFSLLTAATCLPTFALWLTGCPDNKAQPGDAGIASTADAGPPKVEKKLDSARCDAGTQELEAIAKGAKKFCATSANCTEWIRRGNCGSVPVALPYPPPEAEARFRTATESVQVACPDEPRCKWATMGVECRGGLCVPSLDGTLGEPPPQPQTPQPPTPPATP
jgi:hypothetical protein